MELAFFGVIGIVTIVAAGFFGQKLVSPPHLSSS
jgi:hypothetical protein